MDDDDWLIRFIQRHPNFGFGMMMVVVDIYLLFQAWPLVSHKDTWVIGVFLMAPMLIGVNAIAIMIMRLMGLMHRLDARDRERKEREREALFDQAGGLMRALIAKREQDAVFRAGVHAQTDCIGPDFFPDDGDDNEYLWQDACGAVWVWTYGMQWQQRVESS